jgi:hypothetical protein
MLTRKKPPRWEYLVINADDQTRPLAGRLNGLGEDGWELVCSGGQNGQQFVLKRMLPTERTSEM